MVVITSDQRETIIEAVQAMYTEVALAPGRGFHFPTGRAACEFLGYPADALAALPATAVESRPGHDGGDAEEAERERRGHGRR
jgi:hypothetical protein